MSKSIRIPLFALRLAMGWFFFYAGITKVLDPAWSAAGYINGAKNMTWFYQALIQPTMLPVVNAMNAWGLTLLGVSLILGIFVRLSSWLGVALMLLYYFVILQFPYPNAHAFIVDEHIVYSLVLILFASVQAGRVWGLDALRTKMTRGGMLKKIWGWLG